MVALQLVLLLIAVPFSSAVSVVHYVTANGEQACPPDQHCHSLSFYLSRHPNRYFTSNTEFVFMEGEHQLDREKAVSIIKADNLTLRGVGEWVPGPEETVMQSTVVINCTKGRGQLFFFQSTTIIIQGLTFSNCGGYNNHTTAEKLSHGTLLFSWINSLTLIHVSIQKSLGHGLKVYNCNNVKIQNCSVAYTNTYHSSKPPSLKCNRHTSGSNSVFRYYSTPGGAELTVSHSNFTAGCANLYHGGGVVVVASNTSLMMTMNRVYLHQNIHEGGSGMYLWFQNGSNVTFSIAKSTVKGGYVRKGPLSYFAGGVMIETSKSRSSIFIEETELADNSALNGGEMFIGCIQGEMSLYMKGSLITHQKVSTQAHEGLYILGYACHIRNIIIQNLTMSLENAFTNGILMQLIHTIRPHGQVSIQDSRFERNRDMSSVVLLDLDTPVHIFNSVFTKNSNKGGSVISLLINHRLKLSMKNTTISYNNMTALSLWSGDVLFYGYNVIQNNKNTKAAGIFLQGVSYITIQDHSVLVFLNNTSETVGGAIQAGTAREKHTVGDDYCSILVSNTSQVIFSGNQAVEGGSDIYGAKLIDCDDINNHHLGRIGSPTEVSWYFETSLTHGVWFNNTDSLSSMSSDPIMVCFCNSSNLPDCSNRSPRLTHIYPGEEIIAKVATVGYYGGTSAGTVTVSAHNAKVIQPHGPQGTTNRCLNLHLLLQNTSLTSVQSLVNITVNGGLSGWGVSLLVDIKECPPGFHTNRLSGQCECAPLLKNYNISCNVYHSGFKFRRSGNNWFAFINNSVTCLTAYTNCPFDYCDPSPVFFNVLHPERQCIGNRTGILCGQCLPGLSLMLGSNHCAPCSNIYLLLLVTFVLAGILLVALLMALNLTVSAGTVNGLLFYANIVKLNEAFFFPRGRPPMIGQFISWLNLDLGIEVCFFDGLDGYWKTWLQFAFPAYIFLLMVGIIIGCRYSVHLCRLCGSHTVPALATLFLMSYTKILQTVTNALSMSQLDCNGSLLRVWSVDGNITYFSGKHRAMVIFSSCVLVIGIAYPILVLLAPILERYSNKCIPWRWNPVPKLKPLLDAYGGPYKDSYRYWTGITLVVRLGVTVIFSFTRGELVFLNSVIIASIVLIFFFAWLFMKGVYKNILLNLLDSIFLLNLFILANSTLVAFHLNSTYFLEIATITSISISFFIFVVVLLIHFQQKFKLAFLKRMSAVGRKPSAHLQDVLTSEEREEEENESCNGLSKPLGSPPSHVYGSRRGEHQFDLHFPNNVSGNGGLGSSSSPVLREREPLIFDEN